jgi:hypothetical protein
MGRHFTYSNLSFHALFVGYGTLSQSGACLADSFQCGTYQLKPPFMPCRDPAVPLGRSSAIIFIEFVSTLDHDDQWYDYSPARPFDTLSLGSGSSETGSGS